MRRSSRHLCIALGTLLAALAAGQDNLLPNPGFEALDREQQPTQWYCPEYWSGELSSVDDPAHVRDGQRAVLLRAVAKADRTWGRIHPSPMPVTAGLRYRFSIWAAGAGSLKLGIIHYFPERADGSHYEVVWPDTGFELTDQWQEAAYEFSPVSADVNRIATMTEVEGEGAFAYLDEAAVGVLRRAPGEIAVRPPYLMARPGDEATFALKATENDQPLARGAVLAITSEPGAPAQQEVVLDQEGAATFRVATDATESGLQRLAFVQPDIGEAAPAFIDRADAGTYQALDAAAQDAELPGLPAHLLFLGDSLTDFHRGYNYTDQVGFWLRKVNGDQVTFRNAGVGGDYIRRVWQRLNADPAVYRPAAYDNLYEPSPTHVFIFLGHNDSKLTSGSGFTESVVPPAEFEELYRQVVRKIQQDTGARITIISSTSSVYEITEPRARELLEQRGAASLFGKPEVLEQYNAIAKRVAVELGCTYLDVYEPTRTHADKPSLFMADGVHLNLQGNHLVALEILKHLAQ